MDFRKWWFLSNEEVSLLERHWKLSMSNLIHNLLQLYKHFSFLSYFMITVLVVQSVYPNYHLNSMGYLAN